MSDKTQERQDRSEQGLRPVAVLGLGTMGSAVARRLIKGGLTVRVWNRSPGRASELAAAGAIAFDEPADAVSDAGVVVTFLPTAAATTEVMIVRDVVAAMAPGAVWAQMGTIGIETTESLAEATGSRRPDVTFIDAPVLGSRQPAESGQLLVLASGRTGARARLSPIFDIIGRRTFLARPGRHGQPYEASLQHLVGL